MMNVEAKHLILDDIGLKIYQNTSTIWGQAIKIYQNHFGKRQKLVDVLPHEPSPWYTNQVAALIRVVSICESYGFYARFCQAYSS